MKKLMFALVAAVALAAGSASAQGVTATGGCSTCAQGAPAYAGGYAPQYQPAYGYEPSYGYAPSFGTGGFGSHYGVGHLAHPSLGGHAAGFGGRMMSAHKTLLDHVAFGGKGRGGRGEPSMEPTMDAAQGGTLAFPQNPYIRSPRDFFMWEGK